MLFFATGRLAAAVRRGFPKSIDGAPNALAHTQHRAAPLARCLVCRPRYRTGHVGEFEDPALLKVFGEAGAGIFPALAAVEADVRRMCDVRVLGPVEGIIERFYAISAERRVKHPGVVAIAAGARYRLLS